MESTNAMRRRRLGLRTVAAVSIMSMLLAACSSSTSTSPAASTPAPAASQSLAATSSPAASIATKPLLVAINNQATSQYFIDVQSAFVKEVGVLGGVAKTFDSKTDANLTISLMNDAVSAGAKGIAVSAPGTLGPAMDKIAKDAGIVLVATDVSQQDQAGKPIPFVGFDGKAMGTAVGNEAATLIGNAGWLKDSSKKVGVLSVEAQAYPVCQDRTNASKALMIAAGVPAANVYQVPYGGDTSSAQNASGPVITAHPDVTNWVIFSCNDEGVLGALNALASGGAKPANIIGVGLGAYAACKPWFANQPSGFKAALFISGLDVGKAAADVLWDTVVNGKPLPAQTVAKTTMVDPTTYQTIMDPASLAACKA